MNGMTLMVKVISRLTLGLVFLLGSYLFLFARTSHGVGFAGGLIIALALALFMLAYGKEAVLKRINYERLTVMKDVSLLLFAVIAFVLIFSGNAISGMKNFKLLSTLMIVFSNISLSLVSAGCFFLVLLNLLTYKKERHL